LFRIHCPLKGSLKDSSSFIFAKRAAQSAALLLGRLDRRVARPDRSYLTRAIGAGAKGSDLHGRNAFESLALGGARVHDDGIASNILADYSILRTVAARNLGVDAAFLVGAALTLDFELLVTVLDFGFLGALLALNVCYAAQFVHAGTVAFRLGAGTST
jgi:hypothetical protein